MFSQTELQVVFIVAGVLLTANLLAMAFFVLFAKLPDSRFKEAIRNIILKLDEFADSMENAEKCAEAIREINTLLTWKFRWMIPDIVIGRIIDAEVAAIRRMQRATNCPDLHVEEDGGNG